MSGCSYVREHYGVPAQIGMRVIVDGKPGIISEDHGNYIGVNFDEDKPGVVLSCHPTWRVEYTIKSGKIRPLTRSQQRYLRYLEYSDCFNSFLDFCYWDAQQSW
ncbi:hypothetical protein [Halodesulfovibrio sp.]|jgi:hypothetical protein|uniref:hypothetical protein n=1 Tax=Halodesulfovibrio sp. TaxID=1912772 RepID=UPI0025F3F272|nr:hypothetical protein [Halodesulfovibrio sp.]MCT4625842.1 hypothetical protein [Halodesulfovibrio sp.]